MNHGRYPTSNHQQPQQQQILSYHKDKIPGFIALGDSYSAGIGTPTPQSQENPCRQGTGAYPYLIHADLPPSSSPSSFQWLSCTGSSTADVLGDQIGSVNVSLPIAFSTLSIGGDDVGFFDVINACVFRFYAFYSGGCEGVLTAAEGVVSGALGVVGGGRVVMVTVRRMKKRDCWSIGYVWFFWGCSIRCGGRFIRILWFS